MQQLRLESGICDCSCLSTYQYMAVLHICAAKWLLVLTGQVRDGNVQPV